MSHKLRSLAIIGLGIGALLLLSGCTTVSESPLVFADEMRVNEFGQIADTGFEAKELAAVRYSMQQGIGAVHEIASSMSRLRIVVEPVIVDTRFAIADRIFNEAVLAQLQIYAPGNIFYLQGSADSDDDRADYYLANRLQRILRDEPMDHELLLYSYRLIDAKSSEINFEDGAEVKYRPISLENDS